MVYTTYVCWYKWYVAPIGTGMSASKRSKRLKWKEKGTESNQVNRNERTMKLVRDNSKRMCLMCDFHVLLNYSLILHQTINWLFPPPLSSRSLYYYNYYFIVLLSPSIYIWFTRTSIISWTVPISWIHRKSAFNSRARVHNEVAGWNRFLNYESELLLLILSHID